MICTFYKDYTKKSIAMLPPIDSAPAIAKPTAKLMTKSINSIKRNCDGLAKAFVK